MYSFLRVFFNGPLAVYVVVDRGDVAAVFFAIILWTAKFRRV